MISPMDELRAIVMRAGDRWTPTGLPRVDMVRAEACSNQIYPPMLHLVLQGSKTLSIGDQLLPIGAGRYIIVPVDLPATGQIAPDPAGAPYLAVSLTLDPAVIASMLAELEGTGEPGTSEGLCFPVSPLTPDLTDAWLRMMRLMDRPDEAAMLAPMIEREILFRALQGPQGHILWHIAREDGRVSRVRRAVDKIRASYDEPLRVECLATLAGMSVANFYRQFRTVTAMTPIQYQKRLRLLAARRKLLFEPGGAAAAAFSAAMKAPRSLVAIMRGCSACRRCATWRGSSHRRLVLQHRRVRFAKYQRPCSRPKRPPGLRKISPPCRTARDM